MQFLSATYVSATQKYAKAGVLAPFMTEEGIAAANLVYAVRRRAQLALMSKPKV